MTNSRETEELIERYCSGQLTPEELKIFEQWLESDESLTQAVTEHKKIVDAFAIYTNRITLREKLSVIDEELQTEMAGFKAPLKVVQKEYSPIRKFYQRYKVISIAAVVTLVAVSGTLLTGALTGLFNTNTQSTYQALRLEVEKLKRSQRAIINGINDSKSNEDETVVASGFIGSGLALSSEGYVLTSYHVVKDAHKIYISNGKFDQLEVQEVFADKQLDIAVLKVTDSEFKSFGDLPYSIKRTVADAGEKVYTLGYPRQEVVYGEGSVSSNSGFEGDTTAYQVSIPVNPGNSGGPLFDNNANLVGIISGRNMVAEGTSFAVQSKHILHYLNQHEEKFSLTTKKNLKNLDRPAQIKKLKDFVFMVKVFN